MEECYNQIRQWYDPTRHAGLFPEQVEKIYCIYAYVNKATTDRGRKESDIRGNTCNLHSYTAEIASLPQISEFSRSNTEISKEESPEDMETSSPGEMVLTSQDLGQDQSRERAILLLDTGAEVSILDTTFARKVGCNIDTSQECVGIGDNVYTTEGRTRIEITLAGYLVYFFRYLDRRRQNAILGMDFMVPAGVRMDLADGSMRLPDEVGIPLNGRKRLYGEKVRSVVLERNLRIPVGWSEETAAKIKLSATEKLWMTRGKRWVPTVTEGPGRIRYLNIGEEILQLDHRQSASIPRVRVRRVTFYWEWQNLALESTVHTRSEPPELMEDPAEPAVQRPSYPTPRSIRRRADTANIDESRTLISTLETRSRARMADAAQIEATFPNTDKNHPTTPSINPDADRYRSGDAGAVG
ncbi:LOW QUALITY PROTEIN: hypothetical protein PHMEG_00019103 [Phytophthora megakarya]|uniref:Peptidase A2 domain-containing protein n=1 Tax=Phytophthora megakarya TaxID=4795 RepID=A0A225VT71_9STRA|nr:LOW QUALITY PROTEIN: hypothetical protein PHMEG_00019103 [Phytophthora megakarya]